MPVLHMLSVAGKCNKVAFNFLQIHLILANELNNSISVCFNENCCTILVVLRFYKYRGVSLFGSKL